MARRLAQHFTILVASLKMRSINFRFIFSDARLSMKSLRQELDRKLFMHSEPLGLLGLRLDSSSRKSGSEIS